MNIWLLQTGEPLPILKEERRMRTGLLAQKLLERGHQVFWWASAFEHQRKQWISRKDQTFNLASNFSIRVIRGLGYKNNVSVSRYFDHLRVAKKFKYQVKGYDAPEAIVASMPCYHLAYEAMMYARRNHIPFIVDIRDLWPDIFLDPLKKFGLSRFGRLVLARDTTKLRRLLSYADGIVAISKGCLDWGIEKIARSPHQWDRVFYHGYQPSNHFSIGVNDQMSPEFKGKKIFLFVGTFGKSYELDLICEVAKRFGENSNNDIKFCVAGTGEQFTELKNKASRLTNLHLPGWLDAAQIRKLLLSAWVGLVPCKSVVDAAPNKVFEYLSAGLPIISSLEGEIADLINQYQIGLNYPTGDAECLYQSITKLATDEQLRQQMSNAAQTVFEKYGDANHIYDNYAAYIEDLVENYN